MADVWYLGIPDPVDHSAGLSPQERRVVEDFNARVAGVQSLEDILHFLFDTTRDICPCDRISLAFVEEGGRRLVARWVRASYEPVLLGVGWTADLEGSSLKRVVEGGEPRILGDLEAYLREHPDSASTGLLVQEGVRSSMTCPLRVDGRAVGLLFRSSRRAGVYDEHQVRIHLALADRLSQAVEKALRIEQLEVANRANGEMLGFVAHELKSPLATIITVGRALTGGYLGEMQPMHRERVERMVERAEGLLRLVGDYLNLAWLEGDQMRGRLRDGVDLVSEVINPALEDLRSQIESAQIDLQPRLQAALPTCHCDPALLRIALSNLLSNAIKYGVEGGRVELRAEQREQGLRVSVENEGPGFPEEQKRFLFRRFSRLQTPELKRQHGTGVGLYVTWRILQLHRGHIWAESEPGRWARFTFEIPLAVG